MYISYLGDSTPIYLTNIFVVLAPRKPHLRSDTSKSKIPSVSDPERTIHRRGRKERQAIPTKIPESLIEEHPFPSSQEIPVENPEYYSDNPPRGSDRTEVNFHLTPVAEEFKEVAEEAPVNRQLFPSTPQTTAQYIPAVAHTPLPPPPMA